MNNSMFQKLIAGKRNELEYKLMRYYYDKEMDNNRKVTFMFAQYADTLKDIAHVATGYCRSDDEIQLTPSQIDDITSSLGGLFMSYNMKVQGIDITDVLKVLADEFEGNIDQEDITDEEQG